MTHDNELIVRNFIREWDDPAPDAAKLAAYFTEDAVYHNMPVQPVNGRAAIEQTLGGMYTRMVSKGWDVLHLVTEGDTVLTERVDHFEVGGKPVDIEVMGVFELRDGKIAAWRDYFDLGRFQAQTQA